jgi:hypothetical protein
MHILCRTGYHAARPGALCNEGVYFSTCRRCDRDMICSGGRWKCVGRGFRVVWRPVVRSTTPGLPVIYPLAFASEIGRGERALRAKPARHRMVVAGIAVSALNLLLGYCIERLKRWQEIESAQRLARRRVLRLARPV